MKAQWDCEHGFLFLSGMASDHPVFRLGGIWEQSGSQDCLHSRITRKTLEVCRFLGSASWSRGSQVCILEPSQAILNNWSMDRLLGTTALANICSNSLAVHRRKLRPKEAVAFAQIPHGLSGGARNELEIICFSEVVKFSVVPDARARF